MSSASENRVLFFLPTLEVGGAERVCVSYINNFKNIWPILAVQFRRGPLFQALRSKIPVYETVHIECARTPGEVSKQIGWVEIFQRLLSRVPFLLSGTFLLKQARCLAEFSQQHNCRVVASFITLPNIIAILAKMLFNPRLQVVANVHDVTSQILLHSKLHSSERFLLRQLIRHIYPRADVIVTVAKGVKRDLIENFGIPEDRIIVIHNPIDIFTLRSKASEPVSHPWFEKRKQPLVIAVGRLVKLKGFDLLIRAITKLPSQVRLVIVGDGEERAGLEHLIVDLGLADRVALLGFQENPWKYMAKADVFVLSSLTEGLPNVIGEAMALGLPVLATDCSPGIREYLGDSESGLLVPPNDPQALAQGITNILSNKELRETLARKAKERVALFDLPLVVRSYEDLLFQLLEKGTCVSKN